MKKRAKWTRGPWFNVYLGPGSGYEVGLEYHSTPATFSGESQSTKLFGGPCLPDTQTAMTASSTTQVGMRSVRVYRASTCSYYHGHACCWMMCRCLSNMSNVRSSSLAVFGLSSFFRRDLISFFRHFTSSVTRISTSAISTRLKGLNCMLLEPQIQPTFQWRVLQKENHEAAKSGALD